MTVSLFSYEVGPGEDFDTPAVLMTYTHKGLTQMSHNYHNFITCICGPGKA